MAGQVVRPLAQQGAVWHGMAGQGLARQGGAWRGRVGIIYRARSGPARRGVVWFGKAWQGREDLYTRRGQARLGKAGFGVAGLGVAGQGWHYPNAQVTKETYREEKKARFNSKRFSQWT